MSASWKNRDLPKIGASWPTCKKVIFVCFCGGGGPLLLFSLCFCSFWGREAPKRLVSCNFRVVFLFNPSKGLSLKSFFSSCSILSLFFPFVFPFKIPSFFAAFCPSTPVWKRSFWGVSSVFLFVLPFPVLMFACFFETKFPKAPFLNPSCFHAWQFLLCFCCFCFCFHGVCFCLSVCFLFCFRQWKTCWLKAV